MSHVGNPMWSFTVCMVSQKTRNPRDLEILSAEIRSLMTLARDRQPAESEIWYSLGHSWGPIVFREVVPWISLAMDLLPRIVFSYILLTLVSTPLKTIQGCFLHWEKRCYVWWNGKINVSFLGSPAERVFHFKLKIKLSLSVWLFKHLAQPSISQLCSVPLGSCCQV